jgi:hypothetical protein
VLGSFANAAAALRGQRDGDPVHKCAGMCVCPLLEYSRSNPVGEAKSVGFTTAGMHEAERLFRSLFAP